MNCRDLLPILYVGQQDSGAGHVCELATESLDRGLDNFQTPPRLSRRIASRDGFSIRTERSRACDRDDAPRCALREKSQLSIRKAIRSKHAGVMVVSFLQPFTFAASFTMGMSRSVFPRLLAYTTAADTR